MKPLTRALHERVDVEGARPASTPLFQTAAFEGGSPFFYARKGHPNVEEWERAVATLEGAKHGVAAASGMAAISLALSLLAPGDRLVVHRLLYGCSWRFFTRLEKQRGLRVSGVDLERETPPADAAMVFLETPTNPFLRTIDLAKLRAAAPRARIVVDNTWATPLHQRPLAHGADLSIHSATKFLSGHGDVMGGLVLTDDAAIAEKLREERFYSGAVLSPQAAWLLRRSLQTLAVRMRAHVETTGRIASWLAARPEVERVFLPEVDGRQLTGYGGILFFRFAAAHRDGWARFAKALALFRGGTGMAAVTSTAAQPWSGSHASMTPEEKRAIGLDESVIRLCFGLEDPSDLEADLAHAFEALR